jgi:apolipoprotein N-acyltransferase
MGTDPIFPSHRFGKWGLSPYFLAFFSGAATVLAFSPIGLYPLALFTFALLIHLWMRATPRECLWLGFSFGMGLFLAGVSWVYVSLSQFGGMPAPLAAFATLCFCALIGAFPAAAGWLQARIPAPDAARACLVIPAAWTLFEWLRSWVLTGFPWLSAGYAAVGWPTQGLAPLAGMFGASFATLCMAGLVWMLTQPRRKPAPAIALIVLVLGCELLRHVPWTWPVGQPVSVALLQGNIEQEMKFNPRQYAHILETYARLAEETSASLIVLPETAVPRLDDRIDRDYLARLEQAAKRNAGDLLLGVPYHGGRNIYYNSVITLGRSERQVYHKRHLVPFGEFVPPGFAWVMRWLDIPFSDFSSGRADQPPLAVAGQRVSVNICYEDAFGAEIARPLPQATLLVNVSNVAWFGDSLAPAQHLEIARMRAIETGRMHLAATNTGITAAIDRDGRVLARLPQFEEGRLEIAAQGYAGATPYVRWKDWPIVALSIFVLVLFVGYARLQGNR